MPDASSRFSFVSHPHIPRPLALSGLTLALLSVASNPAIAGTTGGPQMPWNGPLNAIVSNLTGPTGRSLVVLSIIIAGIIWAFTRHEEGGKKIGQIAVGGSLILGAATLMASLGFVGAVI